MTEPTPPHPVEEAVALTPERIAELRKIAEGATPGPWDQSHRSDESGMFRTEVYADDGEAVACVAWHPRPKDEAGRIGTYREANALHIATFNPVLVLALLSALERQKEALEQIGNDAEECSFVAAAIEPNERALVALGKRFQGIQKRARSALGGQHG